MNGLKIVYLEILRIIMGKKELEILKMDWRKSPANHTQHPQYLYTKTSTVKDTRIALVRIVLNTEYNA